MQGIGRIIALKPLKIKGISADFVLNFKAGIT